MNPNLKRHLISAANTFITTFIISLGSLLAVIDVTSGTALTAAIISAGSTGLRTTVKLFIEK